MMQEEIHTLVARFLDGMTTLEEEARLYTFFQQEDVPADLREYQEMFRGFAAIASKQSDKRQETKKMPLWVRVTSIAAACLLVVSLIGYTLYKYDMSGPREDELTVQVQTSKPKEEPKMIAEVKKEVKEMVTPKVVEKEEKKEVKKMVEKNVEMNVEEQEIVTVERGVEESVVAEGEQYVAPTAIYAYNQKTDFIYQAPCRMDEFIVKMADYNQVKAVAIDCTSEPGDSTIVSTAYVFEDKEQFDVFTRLLQAACWYDSKAPGYLLNFSHQQFFFTLKDLHKGEKYFWIADRIPGGRILLFSTHMPIDATVSSVCYQEYREKLINFNFSTSYNN